MTTLAACSSVPSSSSETEDGLWEAMAAGVLGNPTAHQSGNSALVRQLAASDKETRDKGVAVLTKWLRVKEDVSEKDLLKIWKGLFYCMWHSDKAPVQTELASNLSGIMLHLSDGMCLSYLSAFLVTIRREWAGIDHLRLDKFYMLIRMFLRRSLQFLEAKKWDSALVTKVVRRFAEGGFSAEGDKARSVGVSLHLCDIFVSELLQSEVAKQNAGSLLLPLLEVLASEKDKRVVQRLQQSVFQAFLGKSQEEENLQTLRGFLPAITDALLNLAGNGETPAFNRKLLFQLHSSYAKQNPESPGTPVQDTPGKHKRQDFQASESTALAVISIEEGETQDGGEGTTPEMPRHEGQGNDHEHGEIEQGEVSMKVAEEGRSDDLDSGMAKEVGKALVAVEQAEGTTEGDAEGEEGAEEGMEGFQKPEELEDGEEGEEEGEEGEEEEEGDEEEEGEGEEEEEDIEGNVADDSDGEDEEEGEEEEDGEEESALVSVRSSMGSTPYAKKRRIVQQEYNPVAGVMEGEQEDEDEEGEGEEEDEEEEEEEGKEGEEDGSMSPGSMSPPRSAVKPCLSLTGAGGQTWGVGDGFRTPEKFIVDAFSSAGFYSGEEQGTGARRTLRTDLGIGEGPASGAKTLSFKKKAAASAGDAGAKKKKEGGKSVKRVRFVLDKNLEFPHGSAPAPPPVRTPPTSQPRGSALKPGVKPGPINMKKLIAAQETSPTKMSADGRKKRKRGPVRAAGVSSPQSLTVRFADVVR